MIRFGYLIPGGSLATAVPIGIGVGDSRLFSPVLVFAVFIFVDATAAFQADTEKRKESPR